MDGGNATKMEGFLVLIFLIGLFAFSVSQYNTLHRLREPIRSSDATLNASISRKRDLSKDLLELAEEVASQERSTFRMLAQAIIATAKEISSARSPSIVLANLAAQYPQLNHFTAFEKTQNFASAIEERIDQALSDRNAKAETYNKFLLQFPANAYASIYNFEAESYRDQSRLYADDEPIKPRSVESILELEKRLDSLL